MHADSGLQAESRMASKEFVGVTVRNMRAQNLSGDTYVGGM